ncbi:hypothetical protein MJD09_04860 [bacterium]|nr:hypothetical protein [bacterium]
MTYVVLPILLLVIFLLIGLFWFMPELRANILIWQGREREARKIFEYLLRQNPDKVNLYCKLAKIYCLEDRRDKKAIRVFEIILKLKIPFQFEEKIIPRVAMHYVKEGRRDSEAIRLLERAVKIELEKMSA